MLVWTRFFYKKADRVGLPHKIPEVKEVTGTFVSIYAPFPRMNMFDCPWFTFFFDGTYTRIWAPDHDFGYWWIEDDILHYKFPDADDDGDVFFSGNDSKYNGIMAQLILNAQADMILLEDNQDT